jgi:hypothetical protein
MDTDQQLDSAAGVASVRLLVVVAQAARGEELRRSLRTLSRGRPLEVGLLAPAFAGSILEYFTSDVDRGIQRALDRLEESFDSLRWGEITVSRREVGEADPMLAIDSALVTFPADEIVLVPSVERDQWAEKELLERVCARFGLPVWEIVLTADERVLATTRG